MELEVVDIVEMDPLTTESTPYHSTWAQDVEEEFGGMAGHAVLEDRERHVSGDRGEDWREKREKPWEILGKIKPKIRKPPVALRNWFGEKPGQSSSDSSSSSQEEEDSWNEVDRRKANRDKITEKKKKLKEKKREICTRMRYMVGVGPIRDATLGYHEQLNDNPEDARRDAVLEYLRYYLAYDDDDIESLEIIETKKAANDEIIYCVFGRTEDVKEIHHKRAASQNDDLVTRDYIPPQMYARYQAVAHRAKIMRAADSNLKTQLRWGGKDLEVYTKTKGSDEQMKLMNLQEFMQNDTLPDYDTNIKWKAKTMDNTEKEEKSELWTRNSWPSILVE